MKSDFIDLPVTLHERTEDAALISANGDPKNAVWLPLSRIKVDSDASVGHETEVSIPEWLAQVRGLIC